MREFTHSVTERDRRHAMWEKFMREASKAESKLFMREREVLIGKGPHHLDQFHAKRARQKAAFDMRMDALEKEFFGSCDRRVRPR